MIIFPRIWELVEGFKLQCCEKGWKVCENEDLVYVEGEYHHFVWTRHIFPRTFRRVVMNPYVSVREGVSHRPVNVSYTAWISPESVSGRILDALAEAPSLSRKVAIYDVSPVYKGERFCLKMNRTKSIVFREFERFLKEKYKVNLRPIHEALRSIESI